MRFSTNFKFRKITCGLSVPLRGLLQVEIRNVALSKKSPHTAKFKAGAISYKRAPANTGNDNNNRIAVTKIAQQNSGNLCSVIPGARMFKIVVMTF